MASDPMEQFQIKPIVPLEVAGFDISFTNSALWMVISIAFSSVLLLVSMRKRAMIPSGGQLIAESLYMTIANMIRDNVGPDGRRYFPFIFTLFMFLLVGNLQGLIPGSFTYTSHVAVTFALAAFIFVVVTVLGFIKNGAGYLRMFFPHGAPLWTAVILVPIEVVSYFSRPFSLAVRLFANMTVGHVLLKVIAGFVIAMGFAGIVPLLGLIAITAFEILVATIQAYVFTILSCVYLNDALHGH